MEQETNAYLFQVDTVLGFQVHTTHRYWQIIVDIKHPVLRGRIADVMAALQTPDQVRRSKGDSQVYLFYRSDGVDRWICAVAKQLDGEGFLVTAYRTGNIKEGEQIWP